MNARIATVLCLFVWACDDGGRAAGDAGDAGDGGVADATPTADGGPDSGPDGAPDGAAADMRPPDAAAPDALPPDAGPPPIRAAFDPDVETLPQPISGQETADLREAFAWADSAAWPELNGDEKPALFYAIVYVASPQEYERLDRLGLHHWALPLFEAERERWAGQLGVIAPIGDGVGSFQFTIPSGGTYNALRDYALAGDPPFQAVIRRDPPEMYLAEDGSLDYAELFKGGFNLSSRDEPVQVEKFTAFAAAIEAARFADDAWNDSLGELENAFRQDKIDVPMRVVPMNTDPRFHLVGERTPMTRAWSSGGRTPFGSTLKIPGLELVVGAGAGHLRRRADAQGWARFNIGRNTRHHVCVRMDNHAARISELWVSMQVCDFGSDRARVFVDPPEPRAYELEIQDWRLNMMAQMSDAFDWSQERLGFRPSRQAKVLVGALADIFGSFNQNRAFALCGGYGLTLQSLEFAALVGLVTAQFALLPLPPEWVALLQVGFADLTFTALSFDIIFPNAPADDAVSSRGVPTHEYGHFMTCDLLRSAGIFDTSWAAVVNLSITVLQAPEVDILYVLEATADYFTSQIAGGTNYYGPPGSAGAGAMSFCQPGSACWEENRQTADVATQTFAGNLAATLTLLHDLFDGGDAEPRAPWVEEGGFIQPSGGQARRDDFDERVELDVRDLVTFFRRLGRRSLVYDRAGFVGIWASILRERGYAENEICALFALHAFMDDCRDWLDGALVEEEIEPSTPILVSSAVVDEIAVELIWRDISLFAETFSVEWGPTGDAPQRDLVPWAREAEFDAVGLDHDTRYSFAIRTENGALTSRAVEVVEVTGAEPVDAIRLVEAVPGGAELEWDATRASSYRVVYAPLFACGDPRCAADCEGALCRGEPGERSVVAPGLVLRDLLPSQSYRATVFAENQLRASAAGSLPLDFETGDVSVLYVDPMGGDDGALGDADSPLASLPAALARAAMGADVVRLTGAHTVDSITLPDGVALDGGWLNQRGEWVETDARAEITVRGAIRTRGGCAAPAGDAAVVGLGDVALRNLALRFDPTGPVRDVCRVGVSVTGADLRLTRVDIGPTRAVSGCVVGAEVLGGDAQIADSLIVGNRAAPGGLAAGLCVADGVDVQVTDSDLVGDSAARPVGYLRLSGASVRAERITVVRSTVRASQVGVTVPSGLLFGLDARASQWLDVHNSVIRTPAGGDENVALEVRDDGPRLPLLRVAFSTLINGDANLAARAGAGHEGSVIRFPTDVERAELVNNAFVLGSSREGELAVMDRSRGANPVDYVLRGNVLSIRQDLARAAVFVLCSPAAGEFDRQARVTEFEASNQVCPPANGRGVGWQVGDNYALDGSARRPAIRVQPGSELEPFSGPVRTDRMGVTRGGTTVAPEAFVTDRFGDPRDPVEPGTGAIAPPAMCAPVRWHVDADEDGFGGVAVDQCEPVADWANRGGDCADNDRQRNPSVAERCDRVDNDCDGPVDEGVANACGGCGAVPADACDGRDNDCDGRVDELSGADESGGRRIDVTLSTRESTTRNARVNSPADVDHYRVHADESRSGNFGCEGGCATANEQTQFRADLTVPGDAGGAFQLCVGNGDGPNAPFQCVNVAPGRRGDLVVAMNGRNCCNGILCDQDNSAFFFATVRGQEACSNSTYRLILTTFEACVP